MKSLISRLSSKESECPEACYDANATITLSSTTQLIVLSHIPQDILPFNPVLTLLHSLKKVQNGLRVDMLVTSTKVHMF